MTRNNEIRVLITAIGGGGHGEQILKALRISKLENLRLFGADSNNLCPQKNLVSSFSVLPLASSDQYDDALLELVSQLKINVLIHGSEAELKKFVILREQLEELGVQVLMNDPNVINVCMDKLKTFEFLENEGFEVPKYSKVSNFGEIEEVDWFPVIVKPHVGGGGSANVFVCQDRHELLNLSRYLHLDSGKNEFLIQEYIGRPNEEYTVGVLSSVDGVIIDSIAVHRLLNSQLNVKTRVPNRTNRYDLGTHLVVSSGVSQGFVGRFPEITSQCERIAVSIGSRGPLNIQCRFVDGKVQIFEINPRFSGTTSLRALAGFNEPEILIRNILFKESFEERIPYSEVTVIRGLTEYLVDSAT